MSKDFVDLREELRRRYDLNDDELITLISAYLLTFDIEELFTDNSSNINYDKIIQSCGCLEYISHALKKIFLKHKPKDLVQLESSILSEVDNKYLAKIKQNKGEEIEYSIFKGLAELSAKIRLSETLNKNDVDFASFVFKEKRKKY